MMDMILKYLSTHIFRVQYPVIAPFLLIIDTNHPPIPKLLQIYEKVNNSLVLYKQQIDFIPTIKAHSRVIMEQRTNQTNKP